MTWTDAVRILAVNSLFELKGDRKCRCDTEKPDPCWNCKTHAALKMAAKRKIIYQDIPEIERSASEAQAPDAGVKT